MGDIMSYAADQERDRWEASPEYAALKIKCSQYNEMLIFFANMECGSLTVAQMRLILRVPHSISADYVRPIPNDSEIEKLKVILKEYA